MSTTIMMKDALRDEVEKASGGKQTVLRTAKGQPTYMNIVTRTGCEGLHPTALGTGTHPAFIVAGVEKTEFFFGTYPAVIRDGEALSLPGEIPATGIGFDAARSACVGAGPGFHLVSNWEWAFIVLQCAAMGIEVRGNTLCGASRSHPDEKGACPKGSFTLTGSGPASWRHDGTPYGIADLVGNVWEWVDGLKLVHGRIIMPADNNYALPEAEWPEASASIDVVDGTPTISDSITTLDWDSERFQDVAAREGFEPPISIKQALLHPYDGLKVPGRFWADNTEPECLPIRGGCWNAVSCAGLAALFLNYRRSDVLSYIGFRPAFIG